MCDGPHTAGEASGKKAVLPPCRYCGEEFSNIGAMREHKRRKVHEENEAGSPLHLWCEICDLDFRTREGVGEHIRQFHAQEQDLTCPGCGDHFVRLSGFVKHIELDECRTLKLENIEERMHQRMLMTKALSNVDKMSKGDVTTQHEKSFYQYLGHDALPAPPWWQGDLKPSPWPQPVEETWAYQKPAESKDEDSLNWARPEQLRGATTAPGALTGNGDNGPEANDDEGVWTQNKNQSQNAGSDKQTAKQLPRHQHEQLAAMEQERDRKLSIAEPNSPYFKPEEFFNKYSGRYKCPHRYCMKSFTNKAAFVQHLRSSAHRRSEISCPTCAKHFDYLFALAAHVESQSRRCHMRESKAYGWFLNQLTWGTAEVAGRHGDYTLKYQLQKGFQEDFGPKKTTRPTYGHQQVYGFGGTAPSKHPQLTAGALAQQQQEMKNSSKQSMLYGQQQQQRENKKQGNDAGRGDSGSMPLMVEALSRVKLQGQKEQQESPDTKTQTSGSAWDQPSSDGWGLSSKPPAMRQQRGSFWNEPEQPQEEQQGGDDDVWGQPPSSAKQHQGGHGAQKGVGYMW